MVLKFYFDVLSAPARAVYFTIKYLNIQAELIECSLLKGENKTKKYLMVNPKGTVPVIDDDGFVLLDSHAINIYLVTKYAEGRKLYPSEVAKRAIVNQRLFFDACELFETMKSVGRKVFFEGATIVGENAVENFENCYKILENYLYGNQYVAGDDLTIADFSVVPMVTTMNIFVPVKEEKFSQLAAYLQRAATWPRYGDVNEPGIRGIKTFLKSTNFIFTQSKDDYGRVL